MSVPRTAPREPIPEAGRDPWALVPAVLLAVPMVAAFALYGFGPAGMLEWAVSREGLAAGYPAPVLLHMFAHAGLLHIGFNLAALLALTPAVVDRLGPLSMRSLAAYLALFLACGLGGLLLWLAFPHTAPMLGASGAIFGLLGFILRQPDPEAPPVPLTSRAIGNAFWTFVKLHLPLIAIFLIPVLLGGSGFGLAWEAHLGGFMAGLLLWGPARRLAGATPSRPAALPPL
ncbi:rhomboid family intramembrane serine protease [Qipengyuania sediminis]|uniref:rhomboid family intramembrane serine protease n=1 Tax=Qipengyuania sediminis TaxID=1532023 RepID=UPI0014048351|nr:rhomboid family intramembrane serine protease [Qipengyuania sediminis]